MKNAEPIRPISAKLAEAGSRLADQAADLTGQMSEQVREGAHQVIRRGARTARALRESAEDRTEEVRLRVRENPFTSVGIAAAAGIVVGLTAGWLIGSRRRD